MLFYKEIYTLSPGTARRPLPKQADEMLDISMWISLGKIFTQLSSDPDVRCVVLSGAGERGFSAGLDVQVSNDPGSIKHQCGTDEASRGTLGCGKRWNSFHGRGPSRRCR